MSKLTKTAITEAFMDLLRQKSLDKITVTEIIESAQINRNTFYYHYEDIYALLDSIFSDEAERFLREIQVEKDFYDQYVTAAAFFIENRDAVEHIYHSKNRAVLQHYLEITLRRIIEIYVDHAAEGTLLSKEGREFVVYFYTYGIVGATLQWVEMNMPEQREGVMRTICDSFYATIRVMIEVYIKGHPEECR